jgi:hypothetical protein
MHILKLKAFARWARREGLDDVSLRNAVREMQHGLVDANLGGGLLKKRVARAGRGKSVGYRTVIAADLRSRCVFLFGFAKSERDDLDQDELRSLKELARSYLGYDEETIESLLAEGELMEVESGQSQTS